MNFLDKTKELTSQRELENSKQRQREAEKVVEALKKVARIKEKVLDVNNKTVLNPGRPLLDYIANNKVDGENVAKQLKNFRDRFLACADSITPNDIQNDNVFYKLGLRPRNNSELTYAYTILTTVLSSWIFVIEYFIKASKTLCHQRSQSERAKKNIEWRIEQFEDFFDNLRLNDDVRLSHNTVSVLLECSSFFMTEQFKKLMADKLTEDNFPDYCQAFLHSGFEEHNSIRDALECLFKLGQGLKDQTLINSNDMVAANVISDIGNQDVAKLGLMLFEVRCMDSEHVDHLFDSGQLVSLNHYFYHRNLCSHTELIKKHCRIAEGINEGINKNLRKINTTYFNHFSSVDDLLNSIADEQIDFDSTALALLSVLFKLALKVSRKIILNGHDLISEDSHDSIVEKLVGELNPSQNLVEDFICQYFTYIAVEKAKNNRHSVRRQLQMRYKELSASLLRIKLGNDFLLTKKYLMGPVYTPIYNYLIDGPFMTKQARVFSEQFKEVDARLSSLLVQADKCEVTL